MGGFLLMASLPHDQGILEFSLSIVMEAVMNTMNTQEQFKREPDKSDAQTNNPETSGSMAMVMHAAKYGLLTLLREQLHTSGIDVVNARDEYGDTALIVAARNGRTGIVKELLQVKGIEVNARREQGKTALIHAAKNGKIEMVKNLLDVPGIDLDVVDKYGKSALMYAEEESHTEIALMIRNAMRTDR